MGALLSIVLTAAGGTVVAVEGGELIVDVGESSGATAGDEAVLFRVVELRHPSTGRRLRDRFRIGTVHFLQVGRTMSLVAPTAPLDREASAGDVIELVQPPREVEAAEAPGPGPDDLAAPCATGPDELGPLRLAWVRASLRPPAERAAVWRDFLREFPDSALAASIHAEVKALESDAAALERALHQRRPPRGVTGGAPAHGHEGRMLHVALQVPEDLLDLQEGRLHFRVLGQEAELLTYRFVSMELEGDGYLRGDIPAAGEGVEWFVTALHEEREIPLAGSAEEPRRVALEPDPLAPPPRVDRSRIGLFVEHVSFDGVSGDDRFLLVESDFLYRIMGPLWSVKLGFGVYQGEGGSREELDRGEPRRVGLNYGYTELELRASPSLALIGRVLAGNGEGGLAGGAEGKLRIGSELGTSLVLGASSTPAIGDAGTVQLAWDTVPGFPMSGSVIVTSMPVAAEPRIRLVYEIRRPVSEVVEVAVRTSYGARDVRHGGFGFGVGTVYRW